LTDAAADRILKIWIAEVPSSGSHDFRSEGRHVGCWRSSTPTTDCSPREIWTLTDEVDFEQWPPSELINENRLAWICIVLGLMVWKRALKW